MNEFWEDFDVQNKLKSDKAKFKFIDFDDPFRPDDKELKQLEEDLYKNFNPNKSPILENYEKLTSEFKMPSRTLIELEKKHYRKYIQTIKRATKTIINRIKAEAKINARKIIADQVESAKLKFEEEISNLLYEHIKTKEDNITLQMKISLLERKLRDQEIMLIQQTNYLNALKVENESNEVSSPTEDQDKYLEDENKNFQHRSSLKNQSAELENEHDTIPLPFHQLVLTKPFSFYSFNYAIYEDQKLDLYKDNVLKLIKFRNRDLEQQARHIQYDMNHLSSQVKELKVEEKEKLKMILDMRNEIVNLKFQIQTDRQNAEQDKIFAVNEVKEESKFAQQHFDLYQQVVNEEVKINESIQRNQKAKISELENMIKKMQKVLSIPRLHYKYLESLVTDSEGRAKISETSPSIQKSASIMNPGVKTSRNIYTNMKTRTIPVNVDGDNQFLKYTQKRMLSPTSPRTQHSIRSPMSCADLKADSKRLLPSYEKFKATIENNKGIISAWSQNQESSESSTQVLAKAN